MLHEIQKKREHDKVSLYMASTSKQDAFVLWKTHTQLTNHTHPTPDIQNKFLVSFCAIKTDYSTAEM